MYAVDNTVLSNFAVVGRMDLLCEILNGDAFITDFVEKEFRYKKSFREIEICFPKTETSPEELEEFENVLRLVGPRGLHSGEISCILQVIGGNADAVLTDDNLARKYCRKERIEVHGTVFVLALAVEKKILALSGAEDLLGEMKKRGYSLDERITVEDAVSDLGNKR